MKVRETKMIVRMFVKVLLRGCRRPFTDITIIATNIITYTIMKDRSVAK